MFTRQQKLRRQRSLGWPLMSFPLIFPTSLPKFEINWTASSTLSTMHFNLKPTLSATLNPNTSKKMHVHNVHYLVLLMDRLLRDEYIQPKSMIRYNAARIYKDGLGVSHSLLGRHTGSGAEDVGNYGELASVHNGLGLLEDVANVACLLVGEVARRMNGNVVTSNSGAVKGSVVKIE
ncbi:3-oxoacyl-(acyl-carrier-protein) reductase [Colletotrichum incanum]|nr:3-oxoacyl-(acyl-carrier-protein) reductase [Colletotrichum incanum]